jgi:hypothetical protein
MLSFELMRSSPVVLLPQQATDSLFASAALMQLSAGIHSAQK